MASGGRFSGLVLDPAQCSRLSLGEKRELVHEIAQWSTDAPAILSSFTRRDLLEIICAEMGRERKYSGYSKINMIERLLKLVSQKTMKNKAADIIDVPPAKTQHGNIRKRQKQSQDVDTIPLNKCKEEHDEIRICQNVACRATLHPEDAFCKRCSCCICHYYDDNKDPSLWLTCGSDCLSENSCGLTCHLVCALKDERSGILTTGDHRKLDGSFYCVGCGKVNGIMRTWRKQMMIAKEARRVDVLCQRVLLGYRILTGTKRYKEIQNSVETAFEKLKNELGPLDLVCAKMARGIVNRLSCGAEVQNLCAYAVEAFDSIVSNRRPDSFEKKEPTSCQIQIKECYPTSVIIELEYTCNLSKDFLGSMLWHRKSTAMDYPEKPTLVILKPDKIFVINDLTPSTEYFCKASLFGNEGILCIQEAKWSTPSSNISFITGLCEHHRVRTAVTADIHPEESSKRMSALGDHLALPQGTNRVNKNLNEGLRIAPPSSEAASLTGSVSPSTPCKSSWMQGVSGLGCKKRIEEIAYEYSVRAVKWLEHGGHIDEEFRVKFLTWFSLKATMQERRVVNVFVDTLIDDPSSLAGQLTHTFADLIFCDQMLVPPKGFCSRLWHRVQKA